MNVFRLATAVLAFSLLGCQQPARQDTARNASTPSASWDAFVAEYIDARFAIQPQHAVWAGRHEFDGGLPDFSRAGWARNAAQLRGARERARAFDADSLDERRRFERDYVVAQIDGLLFWLEVAEAPFTSPGYYGWAMDPNVYVEREYAPLEQRMRAYIKYARAVPAATAQIRDNLRTPMPRTYVQLGHIIFGGLASFYEKDVPGLFAPVSDARLKEEFNAANAGAIQAMKDLNAWFTSLEAGATDQFALGPEKFSQMLRAAEGVDVPIARLKEIGERDLERNLAALREACAQFAPGESIKACVGRVQGRKPAAGPVKGAEAQLRDLRTFVVEKRVVTVPGPELARVNESPPHQRWNAAYIDIPGPYEKNLPSTYFIAPPDPNWSAADQSAYIPGETDLLFVSVHEVWPGHFLQYLHSNRSASLFGRLFSSYAFGEGWAHYSEEMMWEMGLGNGDPAVHIGQLLNALLRDVRYLSAIGLHTGGMTVAESEAMFREKAFKDPGNSRQQAARGTFDPGYGNYTLGKLMIRKLRDDWTATRGGRQSWQAFHDEFLSHGSPPIPLVRKAMLGKDAGPPI
jgi:hypothetical protein